MQVEFNLIDGKCMGTFVLDKEAKNVLVREIRQSDLVPHFNIIEEFEAAHNLKISFKENGDSVLEVLPPPIAEMVPEEVLAAAKAEPVTKTKSKKKKEEEE